MLLIIEDDKEINRLLSEYLRSNGYEVLSLFDGLSIDRILEENTIELLLLDLMLPYKSGDRILSEIRKKSTMPVIIISAKDTIQTKIDLLRLGADDYITKPFDMEETLARVESNLRRTQIQNAPPDVLTYKNLVLDLGNRKALVDEKELVLTAKEYAILELLLKYPQKVYSKANLFQSVWKEEYMCEDNTLNVHISNLRNKLKNASPEVNYIETVWGIGYRLHQSQG